MSGTAGFGHVTVGGMLTVSKVRLGIPGCNIPDCNIPGCGIPDCGEPGSDQHPRGTVGDPASAAEMAADAIVPNGAG